eukprot:scaffold8110_cov267-Pinguiococcus_pyrenoidosus.AAC.3
MKSTSATRALPRLALAAAAVLGMALYTMWSRGEPLRHVWANMMFLSGNPRATVEAHGKYCRVNRQIRVRRASQRHCCCCVCV